MTKLTPQQEMLLSHLRDGQFHCQTEWLGKIKDDRKRFSELNEGYMRERGYIIVGRPCDGRCGKSHPSRLFMRMARKRTPQDGVNCRDDEAQTPLKTLKTASGEEFEAKAYKEAVQA